MLTEQKLTPKNKQRGRFIKIPKYLMAPTGKGYWVSDDEIIFYSAVLNETIRFNSGMTNNLASIPIPLRNLININGPHRLAAALHDSIYDVSGLIPACYVLDKYSAVLSRRQADAVFFEAMLSTKADYWEALDPYQKNLMSRSGLDKYLENVNEPLVSPLMANVMWVGVRLGGWMHWRGS